MSTVVAGPPPHEENIVRGDNEAEEDMNRMESKVQAVNEAEVAVAGPVPSRPRPRPRSASGRRREKAQLSCNSCRQRKMRCDRQKPCSTCVPRGLVCNYAPDNKPLAPLFPKAAPDAVLAMHDRLVQLERLVMHASQTSARDAASQARAGAETIQRLSADGSSPIRETPVDGRSECGSMRMSGSEVHYVNGEHWAAILDSIADLKDHFDREEQLRLANSPDENLNEGGDYKGALLLYGCRRLASREQVLASLPPKAAVDRYISRYFNRVDLVASSAVHGPTFLREYEAFWLEPSRVPIMWVGLLFGMICLAVMTLDASDFTPGDEVEQQRLQIELYRERIVQCLVMGEYTKSGPYVLETIIHYVYVEMLSSADSSKDIWYLLALEVNLAKRMGYHRDPSHFSGFTPLQGEMRRRLWVTVVLGDMLISSQMGMPRMIAGWQCDTAEPRNLYDADLDLDLNLDRTESAELPPARPETEHTTALGVIARSRILAALGAVSDLTVTATPSSYAEVMRADKVLHEAADSIPSLLKMRPIAASMTDSPQLIMSRLFLAHMFYKGQIMLHRRFLHVSEDTAAYSHKACLDAALGTLQIQHILDEETCPEGQLHIMRWRISSIMNHQFLTAAMILCILLQRGQAMQRGEEIKAALRRTRAIWMRSSSRSREAQKGVETVNLVLARFSVDPTHRGPPDAYTEDSMHSEDANSASIVGSSDTMKSYQSEDIFQGTVRHVEPDTLVMPGPPWSDQMGQDTGFQLEAVEGGLTLDEWMVMNGVKSDW